MIRTYVLLPLALTACTVPPASTTEPPKAAVSWPVEAYRPTEATPKKPPKTIIVPALREPPICTKAEIDKLKTEQEQILKKLDCLLESDQ